MQTRPYVTGFSAPLHAGSGSRAAVHDVIANVLQSLQGLFDNLLDYVEDHFFELADRVDGNDQQVSLLTAMRVVRLHREEIVSGFFDGLASDVRKTWPVTDEKSEVHGRSPQLGAVNFDEITIQSDAQAEISAAKAVILSRGYVDCGHRHATLRVTINSVFGTSDVSEATSPIGLTALTDRFCESLDALPLENAIVLSLLSLFEREVVAKLGEVYAGALAQLADLNVAILSPERPVGSGRGPVRSADTRTSAATAAFGELQTYLARTDSSSAASFPVGASVASSLHDPVQLVDSLQFAQSQYLEEMREGRVGPASPPTLQKFIQAMPLRDEALRHAGTDELDVLRLVSDLFVHIFANANTSLGCRELLARLQFPVLATAILDRSFFGEKDHPARLFLNRLAQEGIGWPASEAALKKHRLYLAAEALVQSLIDAFPKLSGDSFARALERWEDLVARRRNHTGVAERRINETVLGKARLNAARRIVEREVNQAVGTRLPATVVAFIKDTWFHVLVMICMKHGTESQEWIEAKDVYRDLVAASCTDSIGTGASVSAIAADLMKRLTRGLELSGRVDINVRKALDDVKRALQARVEQSGVVTADAMPQFTAMPAIELSTGHDGKHVREIDRRLAALVPGTWIEVDRDGADHPLRCRLVVIVDQTQTFVFSNDEGLKVYETNAADLVENLETGRLQILDEEPLVDRAMGDLLHQLKSR